jgi:glucan phosphoethanolaminetransferase (alkaline phosphatase superfamily)
MANVTKRFLWLSAYAIAMAFLEAAVIVYIRGLLHVTNDHVVLGPYVCMETAREAATVVMLVAVGWLAGRRPLDRWACGLFAFGLWDIFYYVWLKVLIGWPETLLGWDTLFLIPLTWWGPVLAPVLIALLVCIVAVLAVVRLERGERLEVTPLRAGACAAGGLLALYVFMSDSLAAWLRGQADWATLRPGPFKWPLFLLALALMAIPTLAAVWPGRSHCAESRTRSGTVASTD